MLRLRHEVNDFRQFCQKQIELSELSLTDSQKGQTCNRDNRQATGPCQTLSLTEQLENIETKKQVCLRKQQLFDLEAELVEREKQLYDRKRNLKEYEKELVEIEEMLNHRQAICDRRQKALVNLDQELQSLREEFEDTRDHIQSEGTIPDLNSQRARKNWDMVRRNLMDRQHLLETTVHKYRTELATAASTIAGKDILIRKLQNEIMEHDDEIDKRDWRIKQLETKLALTVSETRHLQDQLNCKPQQDVLTVTTFSNSENTNDQQTPTARISHEVTPEYQRISFRNVLYRRPSNNANSEQTDDYSASDHRRMKLFRNDNKIVSKRNNSISDNAISRLTLSTPRPDDKSGRGSNTCAIQ